MRPLILLFFLLQAFAFNSCKKDDPTPPVPDTGKELQAKLLGKWSVENVDIKQYENDKLDEDASGSAEFEEEEFVITFYEDRLVFTSDGESDTYEISYDSINSFRYGLGTGLYEAEVEFEDGKLIWKEKASISSTQRIEVTITLHKSKST
ncbi:hypothetical protein [Solitalea longa]|nr:hypothetical protein [Solitalea longa]